MWAAVLNDENEFQSIIGHLTKTLLLPFDKEVTATGARIARSTQNSSVPVFALAPDNFSSTNNVLLWLQHNIHPQVFVSTGLLRACNSVFSERAYHVPVSCIRSAGRVDFGGIPILYEELYFDSNIQTAIRNLLELADNLEGKCFGPGKDIPLPQDRDYVFKTFQAEATDINLGEFTRTVRSLGASSACLKVFSESQKPIEDLCLAWEKICRWRMEPPQHT